MQELFILSSYLWLVNSYIYARWDLVGFYQIITMLGTPRPFIDHVYENPGLEMENFFFF